MKKIVIASSGLMDLFTSYDVASLIELGIKQHHAYASIRKFIITDGGFGTTEALVKAGGGMLYHEQVTGPLGEPVRGSYALLNDGETGVVEVASASGMSLIKDYRNPMYTTSYGTGELISAAVQQGCKKIYVGLGGSATNDAGAGMLQALGVRLLNARGEQIPKGAIGLKQLAAIDVSKVSRQINNVSFIGLCDVNNALCGITGTSFSFAIYKGASLEAAKVLDETLLNFAYVVERQLGKRVKDIPGTGAAGGIAAGLMAVLGARLCSGAETIVDLLEMETLMKKEHIDLVVTGCGKLPDSKVNSSIPKVIARLSKKYKIPVLGIMQEGMEEDPGIVDMEKTAFFPVSKSLLKRQIENSIVNSVKKAVEAIKYGESGRLA
ncbi:MAG: glycerate kinase [Clostridia bacterium]|nr:glycerate kinase [Clostridia bacterium]